MKRELDRRECGAVESWRRQRRGDLCFSSPCAPSSSLQKSYGRLFDAAHVMGACGDWQWTLSAFGLGSERLDSANILRRCLLVLTWCSSLTPARGMRRYPSLPLLRTNHRLPPPAGPRALCSPSQPLHARAFSEAPNLSPTQEQSVSDVCRLSDAQCSLAPTYSSEILPRCCSMESIFTSCE